MKVLAKKRMLRVLVVLGLMLAVASAAQAKLMYCRSDPIVILSNGTILDISAGVSTMLWNVKEVHYELHIPRGVKVIAYIHTPAWLFSQETFTAIADQEPGVYSAITTARTRTGDATVTAYFTLLSALRVKLDYAQGSAAEMVPIFLEVAHG